MAKCTLIIIFNHRYDKNIAKLDLIYGHRFSDILYLVPFYDGNDSRVIPVYDSSYQFQGYIAQAAAKIKEHLSDHYVFIGDDLILNPDINENNIDQYFKLDKETSYIDSAKDLANMVGWLFKERFLNAIDAFEKYNGTEYKNELLDAELAFQRANEKGYQKNHIGMKHLLNGCNTKKELIKRFLQHPKESFHLLCVGKELSYPLWGGYSDIFIISHMDFDNVTRMCGIFAAQRLFVEIAIPTSIMLNCQKIRFQKDLACKAKIIWGDSEKQEIETIYNCNYSNLKNDWPADTSYIHPIKLSRWTIE